MVMEKKDIYEHLAKIYLGSTSAKKKKASTKDFKNFIFISIAIILGVFILLSTLSYKHKFSLQESVLIISPDIVKINYKFSPTQKEIHYWDLNDLNLSEYKELGFSIKKSNNDDIVSLRVEFTNVYKEKAEVYIKDISNKWRDYKFNLSDFKTISDWSLMKNLAFIIEEWNTKENRGIIYIDNLRFLK
jgi:hypothetical protein